jgi:hypothetical protein
MSSPAQSVLDAVAEAGFEALGWFKPQRDDRVPEADGQAAQAVVLIGNAGAMMFARFAAASDPAADSLDEWTRTTIESVASGFAAKALFPFESPPLPFLTWARRGGGGHISPIGLNIHPRYGLWHAYRAALVFYREIELPPAPSGASPCDNSLAKPCLTTCPVSAFSFRAYDVETCRRYLEWPAGLNSVEGGCLARRA